MTTYLAGVDEVGRGCIFGPVIAAAVILGKYQNPELKDSKKLSPKKRIQLCNFCTCSLMECCASFWNDVPSIVFAGPFGSAVNVFDVCI